MRTPLTVICDECRWEAGYGFAVADFWDLRDEGDMCSECIAESEGRPDPSVQDAS